jgi:hypothetical protein
VEFFTLRNTVILALTQVGVVVAGVLAAGACHKWYTTVGLTPYPRTTLVADYGFVALAVPVAWVALAVYVLRREDESADEHKAYVVAAGVAVLVLFVVGVGYAAAMPWLRLFGGCGYTLSA